MADEIVLRIGEVSAVTLKGRGSAGYRWQFAVDNPEAVWVERALPSGSAADTTPGSSADERFSVIGKAAGAATIHFTQTRAFGPPKPPLATYELHVRVSALKP